MWLSLASEAMFFITMLGAFIVLQSTAQQHELFVKSSQMLSVWIGIASAICLITSSIALLLDRSLSKWVAITAAILFLLLQLHQQSALLDHHTRLYWDASGLCLDDGSGLPSRQMPAPQPLDIHTITASDFDGARLQFNSVTSAKGVQQWNYGPSRNNFFAAYFLMSSAHGLHVLAGVAAMLWYLLFRKGKLPAPLQNYWHFVNAVGVLGLAALYFV
jgi:heme/copper-type cytochrome/quinol oxidase subunit 3